MLTKADAAPPPDVGAGRTADAIAFVGGALVLGFGTLLFGVTLLAVVTVWRQRAAWVARS